MEFTTEMGRLGREISRAAQERAGRLCRIREDTEQFLSTARANLLQVAAESRETRREEVHRLRTQTKRFLKEAGRLHEEVSNRIKDGLVHFVDELRKGVEGRRQEFAADFRGGARLFHKLLRQAATQCAAEPAMAKAHDAPGPASHRRAPTSRRRTARTMQHGAA